MTNSNEPTPRRPASPTLLGIRATLILLAATVIGVGVGVLSAMAGQSQAAAAIAGLVAGGASTVGLNSLVGR